MVKYEMTGLKQYKTNFAIFKEIEDHNSGTILNLIKVYLLTCPPPFVAVWEILQSSLHKFKFLKTLHANLFPYEDPHIITSI